MKVSSTGAISFSTLGEVFGLTKPYKLSALYRGGENMPDYAANSQVPTSGQLSLSKFYGTRHKLPQAAYSTYLPVGEPVTVPATPAIPVSYLSPSSVSTQMDGNYIRARLAAQVKTWDTSVPGQVRFWVAMQHGAYTKAAEIVLTNNAAGISAYQSQACYWHGDLLNDAGWTLSGGIPAGAIWNIAGPGGYGVVNLEITY